MKKLLLLLSGTAWMVVAFFAQEPLLQEQAWDGSRMTPVHLIPLKDEFDETIIPTESYPLPFSSRFTCEPCHPYQTISQGLHFNTLKAINLGRPGEPWIWADEKTGTLLPLSYQGWKGTWDPAELDLSFWDFTLLFGRHLAGGGVGEPGEKEVSSGSRWSVSGRLEVNCLGCHNASNIQNHSAWAIQILRENFRWAATAAAGLGEIGGMASRLPATWDIFDGPNPDDTEWAVVPSVRYNKNLFDSRHYVFLDLSYKPEDSRCLACHSVTPLEMNKYAFDGDIHTEAGLKCVSCHRHGLDHAMIRGYEGELTKNSAEDGGFTCAGCHLGDQGRKGGGGKAGRLGAPYPLHRGLPPVHLERLSCTVCHSGSLPDKNLTRVRTSRANRLGIYGIARWATDLPAIVEPIFIREPESKLAPYRLLWPAFWAEKKGGRYFPVRPGKILETGGEILEVQEGAADLLVRLTGVLEDDQKAGLLIREKIYDFNLDGGLDVSSYKEKKLPQEEMLWIVRKEGKIFPLLQEFDPEGEEAPDIEARVQLYLEALTGARFSRREPAMVYQNFLYRLQEGYLERTENPGTLEPRPKLGWLIGDTVKPLLSEFEVRTIIALTGIEETLTEEQVALVLEALIKKGLEGESDEAEGYAYISAGKMFELSEEGKLAARDHELAEPVAWPLAHQVRPARRSLGIQGCKDCHSAKSTFFFNRVRGTGPLLSGARMNRSGHSFMGLAKSYHWLFGLSFVARPLFKSFLSVAALVIAAILFLAFLLTLGRLTGLIEKRR